MGALLMEDRDYSVLRAAIGRIRRRGMTVTGWARVHGFKPDTVFKILHGYYSSHNGRVARRVLAALRRDGFINS